MYRSRFVECRAETCSILSINRQNRHNMIDRSLRRKKRSSKPLMPHSEIMTYGFFLVVAPFAFQRQQKSS